MQRFWRLTSVVVVFLNSPHGSSAFGYLPKSTLFTVRTSATVATNLSMSEKNDDTIQPAPPINGFPGQDMVEEQPVRYPIDSRSTVLIVGGSRGIGLEFVRQCAAKGAKVIATHRSKNVPPDLQSLVERNRQKKSNVETLCVDVSDETSVANAAQELAKRSNFDRLTHIIHSAGVYPIGMSLDGTARGGRPPQPQVTKDDMMTSYLINAVGPLLVAQAFSPLLGRNPDSPETHLPVYSILSSKVGSVYDNTSGGTYAYRSSKAAVNNICKSLSVDLAGIASVICLHPGYVRTDMTGGKGLIDADESVTGMLRAVEATDRTVGFRFVDYKACIIPW